MSGGGVASGLCLPSSSPASKGWASVAMDSGGVVESGTAACEGGEMVCWQKAGGQDSRSHWGQAVSGSWQRDGRVCSQVWVGVLLRGREYEEAVGRIGWQKCGGAEGEDSGSESRGCGGNTSQCQGWLWRRTPATSGSREVAAFLALAVPCGDDWLFAPTPTSTYLCACLYAPVHVCPGWACSWAALQLLQAGDRRCSSSAGCGAAAHATRQEGLFTGLL